MCDEGERDNFSAPSDVRLNKNSWLDVQLMWLLTANVGELTEQQTVMSVAKVLMFNPQTVVLL